jgi:hypothetical protein
MLASGRARKLAVERLEQTDHPDGSEDEPGLGRRLDVLLHEAMAVDVIKDDDSVIRQPRNNVLYYPTHFLRVFRAVVVKKINAVDLPQNLGEVDAITLMEECPTREEFFIYTKARMIPRNDTREVATEKVASPIRLQSL